MEAHILIVDDLPANLLALEAVLEPLSRPIVRADSGEAALLYLLNREVAVILLDVQMSGMDGFQTAAMIRARPRTSHIPIIFITAHDEEFRQARRAYDLGAFDYVRKPFDAEVLRTKVAGFVHLYEQAQELRLAREATRVRDVCLAVLGHDLRNPLNAIQLAAGAMSHADDLPERHKKYVDRIANATARMERLISNVLDFTRGELGGGMTLRRERARLSTIARQIVDEVRGTHPDRKVELIVENDLDGEWDVARIGQLLSNLVGNALQHSSRDPIVVHVGGDPRGASLTVTNAGAIPQGIRDRLFEPFRRGDDSTTGLGLGLYIVREIVKAHGGTVELHCDDGRKQTSFVVTLPRRIAADALSAT